MEFRILGSVEVRGPDGERVPLGGPRQRALLCALLLSDDETVSVERLGELVWGADLPADPRGAVQTGVSRLRRALPESARLESTVGGYRVERAGARFDLDHFRALVGSASRQRRGGDHAGAADLLRDALELWRGEPLADLGDMPIVATASARLAEERLGALEDRIAADLEVGLHREVVAELQQLVIDHPLRERLHALLMLALYRDGRQVEALEVYRGARTMLIDELGVEPGADLRELHDQVLQQDADLASADAESGPAHNLPNPVTSFVGRADDLDAVRALLATARLVSLTGPGGIGKSRLAREAGAAVLSEHPDGVWWVELASMSRPDLLPCEVADALDIVAPPDRSVVPALVEHSRDRRMLLVLDNCDQVLDAAAELVSTLQRSCAHLRVLVTSREPLAAEGEHIWPVPTLAVPRSPQDQALAEGLLAHSAVELFCDRARAAEPVFALTTDNARAVARICAQLDGLPLAIELAAAWVRTLACEQIAERLESSAAILNASRRGADPRHRTLTSTLDWSYDRLDEAEQTVLRRLGVFVDGFTVDSAEAVLGADTQGSIRRCLARLHACSLIVTDGEPGRYRLLEPVRRYALAKLDAAAESRPGVSEHPR